MRERKPVDGPAEIRISCTVCRSAQTIEFTKGVQALRRALILGEQSNVEGIVFDPKH